MSNVEEQTYYDTELHCSVLDYRGSVQLKYIPKGGVEILNSYTIKSDLLKFALIERFLEMPGVNFGKRDANSLFVEWKAHNILYNKGLFKRRTKNTGLNPKESLIRRGFYRFIVFLFNEK